jgi:hypothetical protein
VSRRTKSMAEFARYRTKAAAYAVGEMPHEPKVALTPGQYLRHDADM